jgi:hypothetical protein
MSFYLDMQNVASDVLRDFDQSLGSGNPDDGLWFIKTIPGNGSADDPGPSTDADPFKLDGAAQGVSFKYVDNALILASDFQATVAVHPELIGDEDDVKGFVRMDGARYKVRRVDNIPPSGVTIAHRIFFGK